VNWLLVQTVSPTPTLRALAHPIPLIGIPPSPGTLFSDTSNNYYALEGATDWNGAQPYGQQSGQPPQQQQQYGVMHQSLDQHQMQPTTPVSAPNLALYESVSTPNNNNNSSSLSSLPPMSSFTNRPPQVTPSPYISSTTTPSMVPSPGPVDIKPDLTSLYPTAALDQSQGGQQWPLA